MGAPQNKPLILPAIPFGGARDVNKGPSVVPDDGNYQEDSATAMRRALDQFTNGAVQIEPSTHRDESTLLGNDRNFENLCREFHRCPGQTHGGVYVPFGQRDFGAAHGSVGAQGTGNYIGLRAKVHF